MVGAPGTEFEPPPSAEPSRPVPRYRLVQLLSILLIVGGLLAVATAVGLSLDAVPGDGPQGGVAGSGQLLLGGGLALVAGLLLNVGRALAVRRFLPPERYRGPSILVLLLLAGVISTAASLLVADDLVALGGDATPSVAGSLLLLTVTQAALLVVSAAFVFWPRALAGVRLVPSRGVMRSVALGLALALPVWFGAQVVNVVVSLCLQALGLEFDPGITDAAMALVDPLVLVLALVVVAPVAEETFFRGVVYNAWEREYGSRLAVGGSALLFALIHGSIFVLVPIVLLGVLLAVFYRRTRSLPAAIALHAGFNAISLALALLVRYEVIRVPAT
ncbi:MAG TPA: type II CAAX endopeptidase family protein [Candidatus Limnocylindria bacterium]|nr:type II CAAX endopeptidase family protein [Candidatus Limnocylindria bacterium]